MKPGLKTVKVGQKVKIPYWEYFGLTAYKSMDLIGTITKIENDIYTISINNDSKHVVRLCCNEFALVIDN